MDGGGRRSLSNALHQNVIHFPQSLLGVDALGAGFFENRYDKLDFFATKISIIASMWV